MKVPDHASCTFTLSNGAHVPSVRVGNGPVPVVYIPGAGDGLSTVDEAARRLAWTFRHRAPHHEMQILSRRHHVPAGYRMSDHARDVIEVLERLDLGPVLLECNSAGGPIGQMVAFERPDLVRALVLASTTHRVDAASTAILQRWLAMAHEERWGDLAWDTMLTTYRRAAHARWAAPLVNPLLALAARPRDANRMPQLLAGLLGFDQSKILPQITAPTLVFAGTEDPLFGPHLQQEMSAALPHSRLVLAPGYKHGADLESSRYPAAVTQLINVSFDAAT